LVTEADDQTPPPDGYTVSDPEDLAGKQSRLKVGEPEVLAGPPEIPRPPSREEQLKVLGKPAEFSQGVVDPTWYPTSDWENNPRKKNNFAPSRWSRSLIDYEWDPELAYDPDADVSNFNPSTWSQSLIDVIWYPEDGFKLKKLFFQPTEPAAPAEAVVEVAVPALTERSTGSTPVASPSRVLIGTHKRPGRTVLSSTTDRVACARQALQPMVSGAEVAWDAIQVDTVEEKVYAALPIELYAGRVALGDQSVQAMFTVVEGDCYPLNGRPEAPKNFPVAVAFNAALRATPFPRSASDGTKIDYAFAIVSLVEAGDRTSQAAAIELIENEGDLRRLTKDTLKDCEVSKGHQRQEAHKAIEAFEAPVVSRKMGMEVVKLTTWSRRGGHVKRYTVSISPAGKATLESERLASHIGPHSINN
jgi:hypothetical protein